MVIITYVGAGIGELTPKPQIVQELWKIFGTIPRLETGAVAISTSVYVIHGQPLKYETTSMYIVHTISTSIHTLSNLILCLEDH